MAGIRKLLQIQKRLMPLLSRSDLAQSGSTAQEYNVVRSSTPNALTDVTGIPISALPGAENPDDSDVLAGVQENETKQFRLSTLLEWIKGEIRPNDIGAQIKIIASGILKGDGQGGVSAATPGTDYGTYSKPSGGIPASDLASGVVPSASDATPQALGTAAAGSSNDYSRADHVHQMPEIPSNVEANPSGAATDTLTKLQVDQTIYAIDGIDYLTVVNGQICVVYEVTP